MAATKYQVLYRYTNPNSNQFITNDVETDPKLLSKAPTIEDLKTNLMEEIQNEEQI